MSDKVLFVDDEPPILDGLRRALHDRFLVSIAVGGEQGLAKLRTDGPFAVVVSDMQMPGVSGVEFLARASEMVPDTVRILLTGHADVNAAIDAVNRGSVFRFLTKPCEKPVLLEAIRKAVALYHATVDEKKKLKKAEMIERLQTGWDSQDIYQTGKFERDGALPGPTEAKSELQIRFGHDAHSYVVLVKMTMLKTIEARYGEKAANEYLEGTIRFMKQALQPNDRLFHWSKDVLMALLQRQIGPAALRLDISRMMQDRQDWITGLNGSKVMIANSIGFDLLPLSMFASMDEMLVAFDARLTGKL